jgi:hypothetical protein
MIGTGEANCAFGAGVGAGAPMIGTGEANCAFGAGVGAGAIDMNMRDREE